MFPNSPTGRLGENLAAKYLAGRGFLIVATNQRQGHKEIDLICTKDGLTVLVEVKTANSLSPIKPEEQLSAQKIKKLKQARALYCQEQRLDFNSVRFDLIAISLDFKQKMANIKHFKNIF